MPVRPLLGTASCAALLLLGAAAAAPLRRPRRPPRRSTSPWTRRAGSPPTARSPSPAPTAAPLGEAPVYVSSSVSQSKPNVKYGIGGSVAKCDGEEHRWQNSGKAADDALKAGPVKVEATLLELRASGILLLPVPHAVSHHDVTLVEG